MIYSPRDFFSSVSRKPLAVYTRRGSRAQNRRIKLLMDCSSNLLIITGVDAVSFCSFNNEADERVETVFFSEYKGDSIF